MSLELETPPTVQIMPILICTYPHFFLAPLVPTETFEVSHFKTVTFKKSAHYKSRFFPREVIKYFCTQQPPFHLPDPTRSWNEDKTGEATRRERREDGKGSQPDYKHLEHGNG